MLSFENAVLLLMFFLVFIAPLITLFLCRLRSPLVVEPNAKMSSMINYWKRLFWALLALALARVAASNAKSQYHLDPNNLVVEWLLLFIGFGVGIWFSIVSFHLASVVSRRPWAWATSSIVSMFSTTGLIAMGIYGFRVLGRVCQENKRPF